MDNVEVIKDSTVLTDKELAYQDLMIVSPAEASAMLEEAAWWEERTGTPGQGNEIKVEVFSSDLQGQAAAQDFAQVCLAGLNSYDNSEKRLHKIIGQGELPVDAAVASAFALGKVVAKVSAQWRESVEEPFMTRVSSTLHEQGLPSEAVDAATAYYI